MGIISMRIMGLDYGSKTVGVAISDPLGITAQGIETITRKDENKLRKTCARIEALIEEYQVEKIVIGLPKHMNNDIGIRAEKSMEFAEMLKRRTGLEVQMWDERLTTMEAERTLIESNIRREDRKKYIDKIAAVFILQGYLDSVRFTSDELQEETEFFVLEQTKLNGVSYILVTDSEEDDAECLILKDTSAEEEKESIYEIVEDEKELSAILKVFEELLEDIEIER